MTASPNSKLRRWWVAILPLLFFCLGLAFLPLVGIQDDEVLFATAVFHLPGATVFHARVFHHQLPLMLLSYLGALKSWIYFPILTLIRPSYLSIRLPVLLIGAVTIWLFVWFLDRAGGVRLGGDDQRGAGGARCDWAAARARVCGSDGGGGRERGAEETEGA